MQPFKVVRGVAAALPAANIDTDVIMPKQFLKGLDRSGLAQGAFHALRFDAAGARRADFVLNQSAWRDTRFLVVGPNFGCGSSREHAVWGLLQIGVRAILGTTFAGIFFDNCANNGLLALSLADEQVACLAALASDPQRNQITVDLERQRLAYDGGALAFGIDPMRRERFLSGLDPVGATLEASDAIRAFEAEHFKASPWLAAGP